VLRYLDVALRRSLGINPNKESFTVKITGGPDGDVAGNLMKFLYRDYGDNAKIVGIADGFGVAEDPEGLDSTEIKRLVDEGLPITSFDTSKLGKDGIMMPSNTEDGVTRRNTMCFRVKADAFVPAGGRPGTINITNWHNFLDKDTGKPSAPLIVEGANIFTTPEARMELGLKAKVAIVKDSSANKCGVITSSNEIAASMLLSKEEFIANKDELVGDVVKRLRLLAGYEAELLFRTYTNYPGLLPHFSERISFAINKVTDALTHDLENVQPSDPLFIELLPLVEETFPQKLAELARDRISERLPVQYQRNAIASALASRLVYHEGIHLVESQPDERLAERAIMYYRADKDIKTLMKELPDGDGDGAWKSAKELLLKGGARSKLGFF
jgi:glutamate dehydrogenase